MVTQEQYDALALRWERLVAELNELIGESDQLGVPITNGVHYLWNDLRLYLQDLPGRIRDRTAVGERPLQRHDEEPPCE